ncbi:MAG: hypothetical protein O3A63_16925 [Proteobacteria bacterium]|nr:hypothetical protein [Pseudomonadota bacterium]
MDWKHSAAPQDTDIEKVKNLALRLAAAEAHLAAESNLAKRKVVAVFIAWRGGVYRVGTIAG